MSKTDFNSFYNRLINESHITSQRNLAIILEVDSSAISQAKRRNSIPHKWVSVLSHKLGLSPDWIISGIGRKHLNGIENENFGVVPKVVARLSAGAGSFDVSSNIEGYYSFQEKWLRKKGDFKNMVLMDIFGNSMEPELKDGDTVLVDLSQNEILAGAIYAIGVEDTVMVKRIEKLPDKLVLISENKNYSPTYINGDEINRVRILGKIIWICRELN